MRATLPGVETKGHSRLTKLSDAPTPANSDISPPRNRVSRQRPLQQTERIENMLQVQHLVWGF